MVRIILLTDHETVFDLTEFPAKLGRHPSCRVSIDSGMVSRFHAQIIRKGSNYHLEDLGGANGTFINGHQVPRETVYATPLANGDRIKLGPIKLRFENTQPISDFVSGTVMSDSSEVEIVDGNSSTIMGSAAAVGFGAFEVKPEEKLKGILRINNALAGQVDPARIAPLILDSLFEIFPQADRGSILTRQATTDRFVPIAQKTRDEGNDESVRLSRTIMTKVLEEKTGILSADAANDEHFSASESSLE